MLAVLSFGGVTREAEVDAPCCRPTDGPGPVSPLGEVPQERTKLLASKADCSVVSDLRWWRHGGLTFFAAIAQIVQTNDQARIELEMRNFPLC